MRIAKIMPLLNTVWLHYFIYIVYTMYIYVYSILSCLHRHCQHLELALVHLHAKYFRIYICRNPIALLNHTSSTSCESLSLALFLFLSTLRLCVSDCRVYVWPFRPPLGIALSRSAAIIVWPSFSSIYLVRRVMRHTCLPTYLRIHTNFRNHFAHDKQFRRAFSSGSSLLSSIFE